MGRLILAGCAAWIAWQVWDKTASPEQVAVVLAIPLAGLATLSFLRD